MALMKNQSTAWTTLHLVLRIIGVTGLAIAAMGAILWLSLAQVEDGRLLTYVGVGLIGLAILFEFPGWMKQFASRRGAMGANVIFQCALAVGLLGGVNWFAAKHYRRFDLTENREFTLPQDVREQLANLRGETDIVVVQKHRSFGQAGESSIDHYDAAAERKIVDKVKDLVELFQDLGQSFKVEVLDAHDLDYPDRLAAIKKTKPILGEAVDAAPENSVFFHANNKVQRLAFHDIFQLDKEASLQANHGRGNLVLHDQGVGPFARKILNIETKQPRVAVATIHPVLSMSDDTVDVFNQVGMKKLLESQGIGAFDIITKTGLEEGRPEFAAFTFDENQFETLEEERLEYETAIQATKKQMKLVDEILHDLQTASLEQLNQRYIHGQRLGTNSLRFMTRTEFESLKKKGLIGETSDVDEEDRRREIGRFTQDRNLMAIGLERAEPLLEKIRQDQKKLSVDNLEDQRRVSDLQLKMKRLLKDVDLLIVPRITMTDLPKDRMNLPYWLHRFDEKQYAAVQHFMKAGKPVLFLLGPANNDPGRRLDPKDEGPDQIDLALEEMGFKLPGQTVLFDSEMKSFAQRRGNIILAGATKVDLPAVQFNWQPIDLPGKSRIQRSSGSHPIRSSVRLMTKSQGGQMDQSYKLRHDRPVYFFKQSFDPQGGAGIVSALNGVVGPWAATALMLDQISPRLDESAILMVSDAFSWNEDQPYPTRERSPRYEASKPSDANYGTILERRRGPFPLAAAATVTLPQKWYKDGERPGQARVVVIGNGGAFGGKDLNPVQQKLLIDSVNWLLGRDDLLAQDHQPGQYPRLQLSDTEFYAWVWALWAGPVLAATYLGVLVWLVRRMR